MGSNKKSLLNITIPQNKNKLQTYHKVAHIIDNIYLSDYNSARDIQTLSLLKISHIVNCSPQNCQNNFANKIQYLNVEILDEWDANLIENLDAIFTFIAKSQKLNGRVLIHCYRGISRSPSVVIAYIIKNLNINENQALKYCKSRYQQAEPNASFMIQLSQYYRTQQECLRMHLQQQRHLPQHQYLPHPQQQQQQQQQQYWQQGGTHQHCNINLPQNQQFNVKQNIIPFNSNNSNSNSNNSNIINTNNINTNMNINTHNIMSSSNMINNQSIHYSNKNNNLQQTVCQQNYNSNNNPTILNSSNSGSTTTTANLQDMNISQPSQSITFYDTHQGGFNMSREAQQKAALIDERQKLLLNYGNSCQNKINYNKDNVLTGLQNTIQSKTMNLNEGNTNNNMVSKSIPNNQIISHLNATTSNTIYSFQNTQNISFDTQQNPNHQESASVNENKSRKTYEINNSCFPLPPPQISSDQSMYHNISSQIINQKQDDISNEKLIPQYNQFSQNQQQSYSQFQNLNITPQYINTKDTEQQLPLYYQSQDQSGNNNHLIRNFSLQNKGVNQIQSSSRDTIPTTSISLSCQDYSSQIIIESPNDQQHISIQQQPQKQRQQQQSNNPYSATTITQINANMSQRKELLSQLRTEENQNTVNMQVESVNLNEFKERDEKGLKQFEQKSPELIQSNDEFDSSNSMNTKSENNNYQQQQQQQHQQQEQQLDRQTLVIKQVKSIINQQQQQEYQRHSGFQNDSFVSENERSNQENNSLLQQKEIRTSNQSNMSSLNQNENSFSSIIHERKYQNDYYDDVDEETLFGSWPQKKIHSSEFGILSEESLVDKQKGNQNMQYNNEVVEYRNNEYKINFYRNRGQRVFYTLNPVSSSSSSSYKDQLSKQQIQSHLKYSDIISSQNTKKLNTNSSESLLSKRHKPFQSCSSSQIIQSQSPPSQYELIGGEKSGQVLHLDDQGDNNNRLCNSSCILVQSVIIQNNNGDKSLRTSIINNPSITGQNQISSSERNSNDYNNIERERNQSHGSSDQPYSSPIIQQKLSGLSNQLFSPILDSCLLSDTLIDKQKMKDFQSEIQRKSLNYNNIQSPTSLPTYIDYFYDKEQIASSTTTTNRLSLNISSLMQPNTEMSTTAAYQVPIGTIQLSTASNMLQNDNNQMQMNNLNQGNVQNNIQYIPSQRESNVLSSQNNISSCISFNQSQCDQFNGSLQKKSGEPLILQTLKRNSIKSFDIPDQIYGSKGQDEMNSSITPYTQSTSNDQKQEQIEVEIQNPHENDHQYTDSLKQELDYQKGSKQELINNLIRNQNKKIEESQESSEQQQWQYQQMMLPQQVIIGEKQILSQQQSIQTMNVSTGVTPNFNTENVQNREYQSSSSSVVSPYHDKDSLVLELVLINSEPTATEQIQEKVRSLSITPKNKNNNNLQQQN